MLSIFLFSLLVSIIIRVLEWEKEKWGLRVWAQSEWTLVEWVWQSTFGLRMDKVKPNLLLSESLTHTALIKFITPFQVYFESPFWLKLENENSNITIFPKNCERAPHNTFWHFPFSPRFPRHFECYTKHIFWFMLTKIDMCDVSQFNLRNTFQN